MWTRALFNMQKKISYRKRKDKKFVERQRQKKKEELWCWD